MWKYKNEFESIGVRVWPSVKNIDLENVFTSISNSVELLWVICIVGWWKWQALIIGWEELVTN